jgi:hypothetical protein
MLTMLAISIPETPRSTRVAMQQVHSRDVLVTWAKKGMVDVTGIEPVTPCLQSRCSPS